MGGWLDNLEGGLDGWHMRIDMALRGEVQLGKRVEWVAHTAKEIR